MLISCPKCNSFYDIDSSRIPPKGKKFKCAECGNIWTVHPEDLHDIKRSKTKNKGKINPQAVNSSISWRKNQNDVDEMFNRLSKDTKGLFNLSAPVVERTKWDVFKRKVSIFFNPDMILYSIILLILVFAFHICYFNRYEIVEMIPKLENIYEKLNLESVYAGRDVVFKNVKIKDIEEKGKHYTEIAGILYNKGKLSSQILPIKATMRTADGKIEDEAYKILPLERLGPKFSAMFRIVLDNKSNGAKQLTLTFDKDTVERIKDEILEARRVADEQEKERLRKTGRLSFSLTRGFDKF